MLPHVLVLDRELSPSKTAVGAFAQLDFELTIGFCYTGKNHWQCGSDA